MTSSQLAARTRHAAAAAVLRLTDEPIDAAFVLKLCQRATHAMRSDLPAAAALAEAACAAARYAENPRALAEALRMRGHVNHLTGHNRKAVVAYSRAVKILERLHAHLDAGRTRSSALQSLIYLGKYDQALEWAAHARRVFQQERDLLRLARLDSNEANILHRQDRYRQALPLYARAVEGLRTQGDLASTAIALRNMAVCHTALYQFDLALNCYTEAAALYRDKQLPLLAAEIGDNIAQLFHLRGDYIQALQAYRAANIEGRGDTFQTAVARLDQSELLLELNLFSEAAQLAADSIHRFTRLGIRYERAKAFLNQAVAAFHLGDVQLAMRSLSQAKRLFHHEGSLPWEATCDFYKAAFLLHAGDLDAARQSAVSAVNRLDDGPLLTKSIPALLLLSRIEASAGRIVEARRYLNRARQKSEPSNTLPIRFQLAICEGRLCDAEADPQAAWNAYLQARDILETIRGQFGGDGLRISFLADKLDCYARLVSLAIAGAVPCSLQQTFEFVEQAKSRSLAEAVIRPQHDVSAEPQQVRSLREQLSFCYRQLDRADASHPSQSSTNPTTIHHRIQQLESRLSSEWTLRTAAHHPDPPGPAPFTIEKLRACLHPDESLIEYFVAGDDLLGFVIRRDSLNVRPLGSIAAIDDVCRRLRFQMARGVWTSAPAPRNDNRWLTGSLHHLRHLHDLLIAPLSPSLSDGHWTVIPHGVLHRLPFHALHDGAAHLIERRTISYAPSAAVHWHCQTRPPSQGQDAVVFAAADERAPRILHEAAVIAASLPPSTRRFFGPDASLSHWFDHAGRSRLVHLATHGLFREDNPLFSSLRLSDGRLCLYDLYGMHLQADLITLSGCATGVYEPQGGDEVMGLTRGLLIAGARAAQVSLWEVHDEAATHYMTRFYAALQLGQSLASSAQQAALSTRDHHPHPFFWAPFVLTGRVNISLPGIFSTQELHPTAVSNS